MGSAVTGFAELGSAVNGFVELGSAVNGFVELGSAVKGSECVGSGDLAGSCVTQSKIPLKKTGYSTSWRDHANEIQSFFSLGLGFSSSPTVMSASVSHSSEWSAAPSDSMEPSSPSSAASSVSPEMGGNA